MTVNTLKTIISIASGLADTESEIIRGLNKPSGKCGAPRGVNEPISVESLRQLIPVRNLSDVELTAFSIGRYAEKFQSSVKLFEENEPIDGILYLLSGTVIIESSSGGREISAGSAQARFPLSTGERHTTTATAMTPVTVLRVANEVMLTSRKNTDSEIMNDPVELRAIPAELEDSQLFQGLYQNYPEEEIALSILPSVARVITRAFSRDINQNQAARIVESDAVVTAKLISVANSPLFHGHGTIYTPREAINVLGMEAVRYIVNNTCRKYRLLSNNRPFVEQVQHATTESLMISGLCYALATLTEAVDPKLALTAGLLSNIGIMPYSHYIDKFPRQLYKQDEIDRGWPIVRGFLGTFVLEKLGVPEQISEIPLLCDDWMYYSGQHMALIDIVIISRLLAHKEEVGGEGLPPFESIPAIRKIGGKGLTPELSHLLKQMARKRVKKPFSFIKKKQKQ